VCETVTELKRGFRNLESGAPTHGPGLFIGIFGGQPDYAANVLDTKFSMFIFIRSRNIKGSHNFKKSLS